MSGYWVCPYGVVNCTVCRQRLAAYNRPVPMSNRVYLAVPYADKDAAKGIGARWDANKRLWYCDGREGITRFAKWYRTKNNVAVIEQPVEQAAAKTISYDELIEALADADKEEKTITVEYDRVNLPSNINYN